MPDHAWRRRIQYKERERCEESQIRSATGLKDGLAERPGSGMRMLTYFINRAGKGLSAARRASLEMAKELLAKRVHEAREKERKRAV